MQSNFAAERNTSIAKRFLHADMLQKKRFRTIVYFLTALFRFYDPYIRKFFRVVKHT